MLERFFPDMYYESTYIIDFEQYYKDGYRGVIFDIDYHVLILTKQSILSPLHNNSITKIQQFLYEKLYPYRELQYPYRFESIVKNSPM